MSTAAALERNLRAQGFNVTIVSFRVHGNKYFEVTTDNGKRMICYETQAHLIPEMIARFTQEMQDMQEQKISFQT